MDFFEVIKKRHCVRSFDQTREVADEQIKQIIEAGRRAPSAGGIYPVNFAVVREQGKKDKLAEASFGQRFVALAPVVIVVSADIEKTAARYGERGRELYAIQDAAAAAENIFLAATALGLGACWVGAFDEEEVRSILGLSGNIRPLTIMPIGYPL